MRTILNLINKQIVFILSLTIKSYQWCISPLLGKSCRFYPSCSEYALQALRVYGCKGIWLTIKRLLKCGPWHPGGIDFVPNHLPQECAAPALKTNDHELNDLHP